MAKEARDAEEAAGVPEPILLLVATRIRTLRKRAKIKQADLAEAIGTKPSYIVSVEAGDQNLTLKTLARIASALGVSPLTLLLEGELAVAVDEGNLDQFGAVLREAAQHSEHAIHTLQRALEMVAIRTNQPTREAVPKADKDSSK